MTTISVVVPAHNEADSIEPLVRQIAETGVECEIVVVDDASTDQTLERLLRLKEEIAALKVIRHAGNYGQSAALRTGISHSTGEVIVTMDGDGQNDPADVPRLVQALVSSGNPSLQMIAGCRRKRKDTPWRILCSGIANAVRRFFLHDGTPDSGCGLKVFYRSAFTALPYFDHMHRFLPALIRMQGGEVISMEVSHRQRLHGVSKYGTWDRLWAGMVDMAGVCWLRRRSRKVTIARSYL